MNIKCSHVLVFSILFAQIKPGNFGQAFLSIKNVRQLWQNVCEFLPVLKTTHDGFRKRNINVGNIFVDITARFSYLQQWKSRNISNREVELNYTSFTEAELIKEFWKTKFNCLFIWTNLWEVPSKHKRTFSSTLKSVGRTNNVAFMSD